MFIHCTAMEMENKLTLFIFAFTLTAFVQGVPGPGAFKNFTCLSCSGANKFKSVRGIQCLNDTQSITSLLHCNSSWPCSYSEQINKKTGRVISVLRRCLPYHYTGNECTYSNPNLDCIKFCFSENCNNETNIWTSGNENGDGESSGGESVTVCPLLYVGLAMAGYVYFIL